MCLKWRHALRCQSHDQSPHPRSRCRVPLQILAGKGPGGRVGARLCARRGVAGFAVLSKIIQVDMPCVSLFYVNDIGSTGSRGRTVGIPFIYPSP